MLGLIQLVTHADVKVDGQIVGAIPQGIVALIGIEKTDTPEIANKLVEKMINYRIFKDADGKTNLSLKDVNGGLLLVPQFTLVAETAKGMRPGFSRGMPPDEGRVLFEQMLGYAKEVYANVQAGVFGAYMYVSLCNDGPMTFMLEMR